MGGRAQAVKEELIGRVASLARGRLPRGKSEWAERFVRQYYANVPPELRQGKLGEGDAGGG